MPASVLNEKLEQGEVISFQVSAQRPKPISEADSLTLFARPARVAPSFNVHKFPSKTQTPSHTSSKKRTSVEPKFSGPLTVIPFLGFVNGGPDELSPEPSSKRQKVDNGYFRPPITRYTNKKALFRTDNPVANSNNINLDVWAKILSYCEPHFLLRAKTVSKDFCEILKRQSIWRQSRLLHITRVLHVNEQPPDCPDGITEQQYVDLLLGKGCQNRMCRDDNARSVCWAFLVRWCHRCLEAKTRKTQELLNDHRLPNGSRLHDALPMQFCSTSRRTELREVRTGADGQLSYAPFSHSGSYRISRAAWDALEQVYLHQRAQNPTDDELNSWYEGKVAKTLSRMKQRNEICTWRAQCTRTKRPMTQVREDFFVEKARQLNPPIEKDVLERFKAYQDARVTGNDTTDRVWEILKEKILPYRQQAEALNRALSRPRPAAPTDPLNTSVLTSNNWDKLNQRRSSYLGRATQNLVGEQQVILNIARKVFERLTDRTSDAALILMTLNAVYDEYQQLKPKPQGLNYDGSFGTYNLSLDDARMIVELVVAKAIAPDSVRGRVVFGKFGCPACSRERDRQKHYTFEKLFHHLLDEHGKTVGEGCDFWRWALVDQPRRGLSFQTHVQFPWYTLPWPVPLPIRSENQHSTTSRSAFEGRHVRAEEAGSSFPEFFKFAARKLQGTNLSGQTMTKIALEFALDASRERDIETPSLRDFVLAIPDIQSVNPAMEFRFKCGACLRTNSGKRSSRYMTQYLPHESLYTHWQKRHELPQSPIRRRKPVETNRDILHWTEDFWHLPPNEEVNDHIIAGDLQLEEEKRDLQANVGKARRKVNNKTSVIMATKPASQVLDELFDKADSAAGVV